MKNYFKKVYTDIISDIPKINDEDKIKLIIISTILGLGIIYSLFNRA